MNLHTIVMKIIGPVDPVGSTEEDARRLKNLKNLTELINDLLRYHVVPVAIHTTRCAYSMREAGKFAEEFLAGIPESTEY